jgi:hypothetical protein
VRRVRARAPAPELLDLLREGELRPVGLLPRASNDTFLAEVTGEAGTVRVVYKPRDGEAPLWDFPYGTLCRREVAAYLLARALGWPAVPPTVLRDGPFGPGSVQLFVDADPAEHYFTLRDRRQEDFQAVAAFDVVANNADRKSGHCLKGNDGRLWAIDHGICFHAEPKLRTVLWDFAGQPISADILADLRALRERLKTDEPITRMLESMLSAEEMRALRRRVERLITTGRHPDPGHGRHIPWPPV